jgi:hypothetical protein
VERGQDAGAHDRDHQPAGFEEFFRAVVDMVEAGPPTVEAVNSLSAEYGLEGGEAEWLPGVIARYGLTPPPGM